MKKIIRIFTFIAVYCFMNIGETIELKAQNFQCAPAQTNITIPGNTANLNLSENSVAVHPLYPNIVLSANNINYPGGVSAHVSTDWGVTWYPQTYNTLPNSGADPTAMIDLNGFLYVSYLGNGGVSVSRSTDLGNNWSIFTIPNSNSSDKPHSKIDNSCTSIYSGRIYCAWDVASILFTYSTDNGTNWKTPLITLPGSSPGHGVNITTDNAGNVYVIWPIAGRAPLPYNALRFTKSSDGGDTWSTPTTITLQYTAQKSASGWPSMAVNMQDGTLYLVYSGFVPPPQNNYDVFLKKSIDGGLTWSGETVVNQVRTNNQTFPWISCDPMSGYNQNSGYLACIYYDSREGVNNAYVSISTNSGTSWCDMKVSTVDVGNATGNGSDYIGIEFNKGIVYPIWTRNIGSLTYRTQIYPFDVIQRNLTVHDENYSGFNLIQSANTITAYNIILSSGSNVTYKTINSITLLPGFITNDNSYFSADVFHCQNYNTHENIVQNNQVEPSKKDNTAPLEFSLSQNYPNPFNPVTSIKYSLKYDSYVTIKIYNIIGQLVRILVDNLESKGYMEIIWDGTNEYGKQVSSGIYFYKLTARQNAGSLSSDFIDQKKMVIIR